jgi:glycerol uptake facilitator-like aquaporin
MPHVMIPHNLPRRLAAEFLGTALLLAVVIGSGIMGDQLAAGNNAVALLGTTLAIAATLVVLIAIFRPVSGAHFNPVLTLAFLLRREIRPSLAGWYVITQCVGAIAGVYAAHLMFAHPVFEVATKLRDGPAQGFSEFVATFGLMGTIFGTYRSQSKFTPAAVGLYIFGACWFTASTSFANPAVTIARCLSDSFAGIAPGSAPLFIVAQIAGTVAAVVFFGWLFKGEKVK